MQRSPGIIYQGPQSQIFLIEGNIPRARKVAAHGAEHEVADQIEFLSCLPARLASLFPPLLSFSKAATSSWYETPYYDCRTLRDEFSLPATTALDFLPELFQVISNNLHSVRAFISEHDYIKSTYFLRPRKRLLELAKQYPKINSYIHASSVQTPSGETRGPIEWLNHFEDTESQMNFVTSSLVVSTHGQLGLSHILFDENKRSRFILLDVNGVHRNFDVAYDWGKVLQCTVCLYDSILQPDINSISDQPGKSASEVFALNCTKATAILEEHLREQASVTGDRSLLVRSYFACISHMFSSSTYCAKIGGIEMAIRCIEAGLEATARLDTLIGVAQNG